MLKKRGKNYLDNYHLLPFLFMVINMLCSWVFLHCVLHPGVYESERDAPSMGPSPIINIKKEYRETEEETKEILRKLERDNVSVLIINITTYQILHPYLKSFVHVL